MAGRLVYLMGPSGSGKDTVLQGLSRLMGPHAYLAPRLVTRPQTTTEPGAISVSPAEFRRLELGGSLVMSWRANGLDYGIGAHINDRLSAGCDVLVNGSREYLPEARRRYPDLVPVLLRVDEHILHGRLLARGREDKAQIRSRLDRNIHYASLADSIDTRSFFLLDNSGPVEDAINALYRYLHPATTDTGHSHEIDASGHGQRRAATRL